MFWIWNKIDQVSKPADRVCYRPARGDRKMGQKTPLVLARCPNGHEFPLPELLNMGADTSPLTCLQCGVKFLRLLPHTVIQALAFARCPNKHEFPLPELLDIGPGPTPLTCPRCGIKFSSLFPHAVIQRK